MASLTSHAFFYRLKCSSARENDPTNHKQGNNSSIKVNGISTMSTTKVDSNSTATKYASTAPVAETSYVTVAGEQSRQNIPTKKQLVDTHRQGVITQGGVGYTQTVVVRSYEVGADKTHGRSVRTRNQARVMSSLILLLFFLMISLLLL